MQTMENAGLEHTGYNSYAGVAATLFDYEKGLTAENAVTVEKENVVPAGTFRPTWAWWNLRWLCTVR